MPIRLQKWITRDDLRNNPATWYVFGDNLLGIGFGGQAKAMRGEPNAVGIPTKAAPYVYADDSMALHFLSRWVDAFMALDVHLHSGHNVVWPTDGIGTGLADLPTKAPTLWQTLELLRENLFEKYHEDTD